MTRSVWLLLRMQSISSRSQNVAAKRVLLSKASSPALSGVADYKILLKASAAKEIEAIGSKEDRRKIVEKIRDLGPTPRSKGSEKLAGYEDRYRIRQGHYRVVYLIDEVRHEITIFKVGHRKDVYR